MKGNTVYLIFCKYGGRETRLNYPETALQTVHATFDGAYNHMAQIRKHWEEKGFKIKLIDKMEDRFLVVAPYGPYGFFREYFVITRTIDE